MAKKPKLGSGQRFAQFVNKVVSNPKFKPRAGQTKRQAAAAIAASAGRKKYGKKKFQKLSVQGRKSKSSY